MARLDNLPAAGRRSFAGPDRTDLDAHERVLLQRFSERWPRLRVLDLGVGTGRTWFAFGRLAGQYAGVELIAELARRASARTGGEAALVVADAAQLPFRDGGFDLVCFPFNGLDYADPPTRARILGEVVRMLAPGGFFYFTTHSLEWLLAAGEEALSDIERQRAERLDRRVGEETGIVVLHDDAGRGTCYVTHARELAELAAVGLAVAEVHGQTCSCRAYLARLA